MKKQSNLSRLLQIAGSHKYLTLCFLGAFRYQRPHRVGALSTTSGRSFRKCWRLRRISAGRRI